MSEEIFFYNKTKNIIIKLLDNFCQCNDFCNCLEKVPCEFCHEFMHKYGWDLNDKMYFFYGLDIFKIKHQTKNNKVKSYRIKDDIKIDKNVITLLCVSDGHYEIEQDQPEYPMKHITLNDIDTEIDLNTYMISIDDPKIYDHAPIWIDRKCVVCDHYFSYPQLSGINFI